MRWPLIAITLLLTALPSFNLHESGVSDAFDEHNKHDSFVRHHRE
jgi:hypothetical protein